MVEAFGLAAIAPRACQLCNWLHEAHQVCGLAALRPLLPHEQTSAVGLGMSQKRPNPDINGGRAGMSGTGRDLIFHVSPREIYFHSTRACVPVRADDDMVVQRERITALTICPRHLNIGGGQFV